MRSVFVLLFILVFCPFSRAQELIYPNKIFRYLPAPGQFINDPVAGTPAAANLLTSGLTNPVSLGAYGGYIVLGFENPVANNPNNPYGIDMIIYGNASPTHAEPGIVKVMKDQNNNGLPDDTWFEIAGSAHYSEDLSRNYQIEYLNPNQSIAADVSWSDNQGNSSKIYKNSFHTQSYYPNYESFTPESQSKMIFQGNLLRGSVKKQDGIYVSLPYSFGYADMTPLQSQTIKALPDNPYTAGVIEGDGGDGIDISWAMDSDGNYPELDEIDFVMVYSGVNENAGWLGEISTEIRGIVDVSPNETLKGQTKMILLEGVPDQIITSSKILPEAKVFFSGKLQKDEKVIWKSLDPKVIKVIGDTLFAVGSGNAELVVKLMSDTAVFTNIFRMVSSPESIILNVEKRRIEAEEQIEIDFKIVNASGKELSGLIPEITYENPGIVAVSEINDNHFVLTGLTPGTTKVNLSFIAFKELNRQIEIEVIEKPESFEVSFCMGDQENRILAKQNIHVEKADIASFTNRNQQGFLADKPYLTLADAIISALTNSDFEKEGNSFAFRQDEYGGKGLYLWQVGLDWEYKYGWGGYKGDSDHAKTWFAIINDKVFASGFDSIQVFEGDCISLQHIEDSRLQWSHTKVIPERHEISTLESLEFTTQQIDVFPAEDNVFAVSGPFPAVNEEILVDRSAVLPESDMLTSYSGEFKLSFQKAGKYTVSLANSESVEILVSSPLNIKSEVSAPVVYPNPFIDELTIQAEIAQYSSVRIYSIDGSLKYQNQIQSGVTSIVLNLQELEKGMYILELQGNTLKSRQKLCKL